MKRRELLKSSAAFGLLAAVPGPAFESPAGGAAAAPPLAPPAHGSIPVAFLLSEGAVVIDFCGPWEVFQDVSVPGRPGDVFRLYTVAETAAPIRASGGLRITPDYTFADAPAPKVMVIPAQRGRSEATLEWIRKTARSADVTMSVCTGAFLLAQTGMLAGKSATTHHDGYRGLALQFPDVRVKRGARFVEEGNLATAGGLSSGIDLALRVVERYFGRDVATRTAYEMEPTRPTRPSAGRPRRIPCVRSARWRWTRSSRRRRSTRARPTTSAPTSTRSSSRRRPTSSRARLRGPRRPRGADGSRCRP